MEDEIDFIDLNLSFSRQERGGSIRTSLQNPHDLVEDTLRAENVELCLKLKDLTSKHQREIAELQLQNKDLQVKLQELSESWLKKLKEVHGQHIVEKEKLQARIESLVDSDIENKYPQELEQKILDHEVHIKEGHKENIERIDQSVQTNEEPSEVSH